MSAHRTLCEDIEALLPGYLECELTRDATSRVREHLDTCAACRVESLRMERALGALRVLEPVPMPEAIGAGLRAKIAALETPRHSFPQRLRLAAGAAAVLFAAISAAFVGSRYAAGPEEMPAVAARPPSPIVADARSSGPPATESRPALRTAPTAATPSLPRVALRRQNAPASARSEVRMDHAMPASFLDVTDQRGISARMLLAEHGGAANGGGSGHQLPSPVLPPALRDRMDSTWSDHVRIGETVTELRGTADRDQAGRIRSMRVAAETLGGSSELSEGEAEATVTLGASAPSNVSNRVPDMER